ncbi:MAG: sulfotransferase [Parvibaculum sp.]|nr:sulfotransferase [Parvibaculum sp.]
MANSGPRPAVRAACVSEATRMAKKPPISGPAKGPVLAPQAGVRPTVGLPRTAFGGPAPTVGLPPGGGGFRPGLGRVGQGERPSPAEITKVLQLGGAHLAAGRHDHAGQAAAQVLKFEPQNPDALHLLGLVALRKGDAANAEKLIAAAAALMPRHVNVWVNLGNAQREQGKLDEALLAYGRAELLDPDNPEIFLNRGLLYRDNSHALSALSSFKRLIELRPHEASPYLRYAEAANDLGRFQVALEYCDLALERLETTPVALMIFKATAYERLSDFGNALAWASKALAEDPKSAAALQILSRARRRSAKNERTLLLELRSELEQAQPSTMADHEARLVYSELAQICDQLGDVDAAYEYFSCQNQMTSRLPEVQRVDRRRFTDVVDRLIEVFDTKFVSSWTKLPEISVEPTHAAAPVFLVGFPRSGTTLLDQILDAHPQVQVIEERPMLLAARRMFPDYPNDLAGLTEERRREVRGVYWDAMRGEGADLAGRTVVNKMPLDIVHAALIHRVFPESRIVFALRHPADCVLSCFMQDFVPNASMLNFLTMEGSANLYDRVMTIWSKYEALLPLNVARVRYENLVSDLRAEVEPVLQFLGLPWHEAVSDPAAHALKRGTIRTPSYSQVTQPIYSSATDRWRRYDKHLRPVISILEPHIQRFGYSL